MADVKEEYDHEKDYTKNMSSPRLSRDKFNESYIKDKDKQIIFKSNILKIGRPKKSDPHVHRTNTSTQAEFTIDNELLTQPLDLEFINSILIDKIDFNSKYLTEFFFEKSFLQIPSKD